MRIYIDGRDNEAIIFGYSDEIFPVIREISPDDLKGKSTPDFEESFYYPKSKKDIGFIGYSSRIYPSLSPNLHYNEYLSDEAFLISSDSYRILMDKQNAGMLDLNVNIFADFVTASPVSRSYGMCMVDPTAIPFLTPPHANHSKLAYPGHHIAPTGDWLPYSNDLVSEW